MSQKSPRPRTFSVQVDSAYRGPLERVRTIYGKFSKVVSASVHHFLSQPAEVQTQIIQSAAGNHGRETERTRTGARQR